MGRNKGAPAESRYEKYIKLSDPVLRFVNAGY